MHEDGAYARDDTSVADGMLELPVLPAPLRAINQAETVEVTGDAVTLRAGARTDWFVDPAGAPVVENAPALVMPAQGDWMLKARASAEHASTFDAAVLVVVAASRVWAKLCLERSPQGDVMVVSVVTRGESDDCNSVSVAGNDAHLRISRLGPAFAFHHSVDGASWHMTRYFSLGDVGSVDVGFLAQSPTGPGCTASFQEISFSAERLAELRSGV